MTGFLRPALGLALLCSACLASGCEDTTLPDASAPSDLASVADRPAADLPAPDSAKPDAVVPVCPKYKTPVKAGTVTLAALNETSGLVVSRKNLGVLWAHNDSGDSARLFALDTKGKHLGTYKLSGAAAYDYEDMATGPGPVAGAQYLYVGDIGDNAKARSDVKVYRAIEPAVSASQAPVTTDISKVAKLVFSYPDGAHDAETLLVDPKNGDLYIVVKDLNGVSPVYRSAAPHDVTGTRKMTKVTTLTFGKGLLAGAKFTMTTAGDVSPAGDRILIKTYLDIFLWRRAPGVALWKALETKPCALPVAAEPQGEAIAFDAKTRGFYTLSEQKNQPLYLYAPQ